MKKKFLCLAFSALLAAGFTSCSDNDPEMPDDPNNPNQPNNPENPSEPVSYGAYIVSSGAQSVNITGSLGYINYENNTMSEDVFYQANGMYVGDTFNGGCVYNDFILLAVTDSKVLHIVDRNTLKLIKTIQPSTDAGPRQVTAYDGYIYTTLYGSPGYLCRIDPKTYKCELIEVGPQPEYVVAFKDMIYVAVSDGYSTTFDESCIAVVDPKTFTVQTTIKGIKNPVQLGTNGEQLFVCSWGEYDVDWTQINYGIYEIKDNKLSDMIQEATMMAVSGNNIYSICAPWDVTPTYNVYDISTKKASEWIPSEQGVFAPNGMGVDPVTGDVFILSFVEGGYGYPDYNGRGYVSRYASDGTFKSKYDTGVGPVNVFFNAYE